MKSLFGFLLIFLLAAATSNAQIAGPMWQTEKVLKVPESVLYDASQNCLFVSNVNGKPTEKNGKGFISKLSTDGKVLNLKFAAGLNAPKGMAIYQNKLYVSDIDRLAEISLTDPKKIKFYEAPHSQFLNDVAIGKNGIVYVSDTGTGRIYKLENGVFGIWGKVAPLQQPNGLLCDKGHLLIGTGEGIFSADPVSGNVEKLVSLTGGIDGLKAVGNGKYIVSDWKGKVQVVSATGATVLFDTTDKNINAADLEFVPNKDVLLVPTFSDNRVMAYKIKL